MTTILGIKAIDGIVLLADTQLSHLDEDGKIEKKAEIRKIETGKDYAIASTGWTDNNEEFLFKYIKGEIALERFLRLIKQKRNYFREKKDKTPLEQAIEDEEFFALRKYNDYLYEKGSEMTEIIIATNNPQGLYECTNRGIIKTKKDREEIDYIIKGTGTEYVDEFIKEGRYKERGLSENISSNEIRIKEAIILGTMAINRAIETDPYTGGNIEMTVLTQRKVQFYGGKKLKETIERRLGRVYQEIANKYSK